MAKKNKIDESVEADIDFTVDDSAIVAESADVDDAKSLAFAEEAANLVAANIARKGKIDVVLKISPSVLLEKVKGAYDGLVQRVSPIIQGVTAEWASGNVAWSVLEANYQHNIKLKAGEPIKKVTHLTILAAIRDELKDKAETNAQKLGLAFLFNKAMSTSKSKEASFEDVEENLKLVWPAVARSIISATASTMVDADKMALTQKYADKLVDTVKGALMDIIHAMWDDLSA